MSSVASPAAVAGRPLQLLVGGSAAARTAGGTWQIQIRKLLLRLATTSPHPTPHRLGGGVAPELFPSTRCRAARHPGLSGDTT